MLTQERLKELLYYDPETGDWEWLKVTSNVVRVGSKAGCVNTQGYNVIRIDSRLYRAGRLAWFYNYGVWPIEIDHKNTITADDRWLNLREATSQQNKQNRAVRYDNVLSEKGIHQLPSGNYQASIKHNYQVIRLGTFNTLEEAIDARKAAEIKYHDYAPGNEETRQLD